MKMKCDMIQRLFYIFVLILFLFGCDSLKDKSPEQISGIYPHLAYYNDEGECGTGAVVPWAERLWVITYGPHSPFGSSDKLYEITPELERMERKESIGGTHASRMIHRESEQLFIGPYAIDKERNVRVIPFQDAPGRYTGAARHLTLPEEKIYIATMEEGFYEIDVDDLKVTTLFTDVNVERKDGEMAQSSSLLPGVHGKGLYSGQKVLVFSNNGEDTKEALEKFDVESGSLNEWDGKDWKLIRRNQFVEVTGPGGIFGNEHPETDPIWVTGWDHKSVILGIREHDKGWSYYRLPKASHSYDGAHGWNTEWPRIRDVGSEGSPDYLMIMHGMFWKFPETFTSDNSAGIRPRSSYLKVIGDFTRWGDRLVFGCDDSAQREFLNTRKAKGNIAGPGQSNSNLWFTDPLLPDKLGSISAQGSVWQNETIQAGEYSDPFIFAGWEYRNCWIKNRSEHANTYTFEVDEDGSGKWKTLKEVTLNGNSDMYIPFAHSEKGEWIRVKTEKFTTTTVSFNYRDREQRSYVSDSRFEGLATSESSEQLGGLLYALGDNRKSLGLVATKLLDKKMNQVGYHEMKDRLALIPANDDETMDFILQNLKIPQNVITIDSCSVLIVDDQKRRWRLPIFNQSLKDNTEQGLLRICREVATERDLFHAMGTFYELPAENADGFAKIRPVSSHDYQVHDFASYRGMLVMTGVDTDYSGENPHIVFSADRNAAVWTGVIDDLWELGKPVGTGGPWYKTETLAHVPSDPYLIGFYDRKSLALSHDNENNITFTVEVDPTGNGDWMVYKLFEVGPNENFKYQFPEWFHARWVRFLTDGNVRATAILDYQ